MKKRSKVFKAIKILVGLYLLVTIIVFATKVNRELRQDGYYDLWELKKSAQVSSDLKAKAEEIGIKDLSGITLFEVSQESLDKFNQGSGFGPAGRGGLHASLNSCYGRKTCSRDIFVISERSDETKKAILAHEYMHAMFDKHSLGDDRKLVDDLVNIYNNTPQLQKSLESYNESQYVSESLSYACADASDQWLTEYVLETCNKYFDRSKITFLY